MALSTTSSLTPVILTTLSNYIHRNWYSHIIFHYHRLLIDHTHLTYDFLLTGSSPLLCLFYHYSYLLLECPTISLLHIHLLCINLILEWLQLNSFHACSTFNFLGVPYQRCQLYDCLIAFKTFHIFLGHIFL